MSGSEQERKATAAISSGASEAPPHDLFAAVLSYLVPGLGQIYQGRVGKGLLFFTGLYTLFFYGMWMGQWKNVWLPSVRELPDVVVFGYKLEGVPKSLAYRPQFLAQFWMGMAVWPAIVQYYHYDPFKDRGPYFGRFQRAPTEQELNEIQRRSSKRWDLGWVFTVIAGMLNLLVIYDAFAGPMVPEPVSTKAQTPPPSAGGSASGDNASKGTEPGTLSEPFPLSAPTSVISP